MLHWLTKRICPIAMQSMRAPEQLRAPRESQDIVKLASRKSVHKQTLNKASSRIPQRDSTVQEYKWNGTLLLSSDYGFGLVVGFSNLG